MNTGRPHRVLSLILLLSLLLAPVRSTRAAQGAFRIILVPGTVEVSRELEGALTSSLEDAAGILPGIDYFAITDARALGRWNFISVIGLARLHEDGSWSIEDGLWFDLALIEQDETGQWAGAVRGTPGFSSLLGQIPDEMLGPTAKKDLDPLSARPNVGTLVNTGDYAFPWQPGTSMFYGANGVHDNGFSSVASGWKAVDMLSDGDNASGHAPNQLLAASAGTISYRCSDDTSVAIRLGDFFYTHLISNAGLVVGQTFNRGDALGQLKTGTFSANCGFANQDPGWFHVHWGFPNSDLQVQSWTLSITTQNWTDGTTTVTPGGGWIQAGRGGGATSLASVASDGTQGNHDSWDPSISGDGRTVAFSSYADNLVSGDTNSAGDIFVHDRQTGITSRASVASSGAQANGFSEYPAISADGRTVAFASAADNLVENDTNGALDVFVHDLQTGITTRVSVDSGGAQGNNNSGGQRGQAISGDGRYVAFTSDAGNLVSGDTNGSTDIFVHDLQTGVTTRVSVDSTGSQANSFSGYPAISADGRYVAFNSVASDLVATDTNGTGDVFVHDLLTGATTLVSVDSSEAQGNGSSSAPAISSGGQRVVFASDAGNLVSGDTNATTDVFLRDLQNGVTTRVSVDSSGAQGNASSGNFPAISADGRTAAFDSNAGNLVSGDTNESTDTFIHDIQTGITIRVSVGPDGAQGNGGSGAISVLSADGRYAAYASGSSDLVDGDTNGMADIFVHENGNSITVKSTAAQDGWVLESAETSNRGGTMSAAATVFNLGDDAADRQYRSILSFDTSELPDNAVISKALLKIKRQGIVGTNPFKTHAELKVDIRKPYFGLSSGLAIGDFQAGASKPAVATFNKAPAAGAWYSAVLSVTGYPYINLKGPTQLRLRFAKDDNDDMGADYLKFYSGNATAAYRPVLVIEYYIP